MIEKGNIQNNNFKIFGNIEKMKCAIMSTVIIGLVCHFYKFVNYLPNHDSMYNVYNSQNVVGSGRWLLSLVCGISSYYDLPWINGLCSLLFIALTVAVIVEVFEIQKSAIIFIISGLLVCSPAVTETLFFEFTADGYFAAMFMASVSVLFSKIEDKKIFHHIIATILLCGTCGIYQAYISFALVMMVCYCMKILLEKDYEFKEYAYWIARQILIYFVAMLLFWIIWKLCLHFEKVEINHYQGIDKLAINPQNIVMAIEGSIESTLLYFFEWNVLKHHWTTYSIFNAIFLAVSVVLLGYECIKSQLYKSKKKFLLFIICVVSIPFLSCIWKFTSSEVEYRPMMLTSLVMIYIFCAVIEEKYLFKKWVSKIVIAILSIIIFNNIIMANIAYEYMEQEYEKSYAIGMEIVQRIHMLDTESKEIIILGDLGEELALEDTKIPLLSNGLEANLFFDQEHSLLFLKNVFGEEYHTVDEKNKVLKIENSKTVKEMGKWPKSDNIKIIDGVIVIKFND